jgi:restriction system protein
MTMGSLAMQVDITFHYPPELFNLLVDAIPVLNKTKKDVLLFFRGAGVRNEVLADLDQRVRSAPKDIGKFEIARTVLQRLNERGEPTLRERREVLRRVVHFTNFDACWPDDQMKAKGFVASVREIVNQKDAFTRMNQAREEERQARLAAVDQKNQKKQERARKVEVAKQQLYGLFGASLTRQQRGKNLEAALNNLFAAFEISVSEAFHLIRHRRAGRRRYRTQRCLLLLRDEVVQGPVGKGQISEHLVRLMGRDQARGLFISASDFSDPAVPSVDTQSRQLNRHLKTGN